MVSQPRDDLGRFLSPDKDKSHLGFNDKFGGNLGAFLDAAERAGHKISIYSGKRSVERQKQLFDAAVAKYGSVKEARKHVAPPGKSQHNLGLAADLRYATPEAQAWAHKHAKEFGLNFRMSYEPWHIEPIGALSKMGLGIGELLSPKPNPAFPETMTPPQTMAQAMFTPPSRPVTANPPARFAPVPSGTITRSALPSIPASLTPAPVGKVTRAPLGPVGQFTAPAQSLAHPVSSPKPTNLAAAPVSPVTKGPALAPATPNASTLAAQYSQYRPSTVTSMPTVAGMPSIPAATGLPAAKPVAQPLQHPISVPSQVVAPAPVLAPALAPPKEVKDYNVADIAAAPAPRATAYDVYNGLADTALDNTGQNTVGRLPDGTTTVTNKYGVTTGMTPYGKQTTVGSMPSLPGISGPVGKALPGIAGSMIGGYFGGPVGAIAGGLLGKAFAPGGILSGTKNIDTSQIPAALGLPSVTAFARPDNSLRSFPSAPSGGYGSGGRMGASFSNRSRGEMDSISPAASRDISRGVGGLF